MAELDSAAMSDKLADDDHGGFKTLTHCPLASTDAFTAEDVKYIVMLQGQQQSGIMEQLLV